MVVRVHGVDIVPVRFRILRPEKREAQNKTPLTRCFILENFSSYYFLIFFIFIVLNKVLTNFLIFLSSIIRRSTFLQACIMEV